MGPNTVKASDLVAEMEVLLSQQNFQALEVKIMKPKLIKAQSQPVRLLNGSPSRAPNQLATMPRMPATLRSPRYRDRHNQSRCDARYRQESSAL